MKKILFFPIALFLLVLALFVYAQNGVGVTLNEPASGTWLMGFPVDLNFTPSGNTSAEVGYNCSLYANFNGTWATTWGGTLTPQNNSNNGSILDSTKSNFSIQSGLRDNNTGYTWNVGCINNLTGNASVPSFGVNQTFKLDSVAPTIPKITLPLNNSVIGSSNPNVNWTTTTELNFKRYRIQFSNDTDFEVPDIVQEHSVFDINQNKTVFPNGLQQNRNYSMRVVAEDQAGNTAFEYISVVVSNTPPSIVINNYPDNFYTNLSRPLFNITVTHQFVDACQVWLSNGTNGTFDVNGTSFAANVTNASRTNGTLVLSPASGLKNATFRYAFRCNNTGGNYSTFTVNRTITVDSELPAPIACFSPTNFSKSINHKPSLVFNQTTDLNFANYTISVDNNSDFSSPEVVGYGGIQNQSNFTANLRAFNQFDRTWYWSVRAFDKAGNTGSNGNCSVSSLFQLRTDITNHFLLSGWNIVSLVQSGTLNASDLGTGLGASFNTISRYNSSKQFKNYNNGSSTNSDMLFRKGDVVFINVNADTYWENQTWDTSDNYLHNNILNLTNTSGGWNVFGMVNKSGFTIGQIELAIMKSNVNFGNGTALASNTDLYYYNLTNITVPNNNSLQTLVHFNNTAIVTKKFTPHPFNYSFNNKTSVDFGEVIWININASINGTSNLMIVNLSLMGDA